MEFYNQWSKRPPRSSQSFSEPTCTVPNQSMTVQQIIAKYSRTGLVPQSFTKRDDGGNVATDPDFDPLDSGFEVLDDAAAGSSEPAPGGPAPGEPGNSAPAGEGGK